MVGVFALPHAKSEAVKSPAVFVARFKEPVTDWLSMDKTPVEVAIGLVMPRSEAHSTHLRLLSNLAVALMQPDFREHLQNAANADEVAAVINERLAE
jgi:PTS system fructose-specific IIA component